MYASRIQKPYSKAQAQAIAFQEACRKYDFFYSIRSDSVITISKRFTPGDKDAFTEADMFAYSVLDAAPLKGGSIWGTDGGSVGGHVGLTKGEYVLNKSGEGKRFMNALKTWGKWK